MNQFTNKQITQVYLAKSYTEKKPRKTNSIPVNIPEIVPTVPQDNNLTHLFLTNGYFANSNFPKTSGRLLSPHYVTLPLISGGSCPTVMDKGTRFLLMKPADKIEEGYLIYG